MLMGSVRQFSQVRPQEVVLVQGAQRLLAAHANPAAQSVLSMHPHAVPTQRLLVVPVAQLSTGLVVQAQLNGAGVHAGVVAGQRGVPTHTPMPLHASGLVHRSMSSQLSVAGAFTQAVVDVLGAHSWQVLAGSGPGAWTTPATKHPDTHTSLALQIIPEPQGAPAAMAVHGPAASGAPASTGPAEEDAVMREEDGRTPEEAEDAPADEEREPEPDDTVTPEDATLLVDPAADEAEVPPLEEAARDADIPEDTVLDPEEAAPLPPPSATPAVVPHAHVPATQSSPSPQSSLTSQSLPHTSMPSMSLLQADSTSAAKVSHHRIPDIQSSRGRGLTWRG